jgi:hypothetical protein
MVILVDYNTQDISNYDIQYFTKIHIHNYKMNLLNFSNQSCYHYYEIRGNSQILIIYSILELSLKPKISITLFILFIEIDLKLNLTNRNRIL